jgi:hypothetical protein
MGPTFARPQTFRFFLWGYLKSLVCSAPIENEETLNQRIFIPVKPFSTAPGPLKSATIHELTCSCVY